jgi:hydroxyacylglutathione hydrolase
MILDRVTHSGWLSNTWLLADARGGSAVLIDAGGPADEVLALVRAHDVRVTHVLLTHHHGDHAGEAAFLARETGALIGAHRLEVPLLRGRVDVALEDGETIRSGALEVRVLHIPGHTAGQAAYLARAGSPGRAGGEPAICFTGDTLFRGSVGSTAAPGHTTFADLRRSIVERLMALPDEVRVAPGHADPTTIGDERAGNPFVRVMLGLDADGSAEAMYDGRAVRLVVMAGDYDGGTKAWVRYEDGTEATVPGSRIRTK